jgi:NADH-quinone oxidoreductase subunit L
VIRGWYLLSRGLNVFDAKVVDGLVNGTGIGTLRFSDIQNWIDQYLVDGLVNAVGAVSRGVSSVLRKVQTGLVQNYLLVLFLGVLIMLLFESR